MEVDRLADLRNALKTQHMHGFILPVNDEFMGEYVPDSARRLQWLTGFTGSAGMAAILPQKAAFFTDGRYSLQAKDQVTGYDIYNSIDVTPSQWLAMHAPEGSVIGYDPMLHSLNQLRQYERNQAIVFTPCLPNPVDALWHDRPAAPHASALIQAIEYSGEHAETKRARMAQIICERQADALLITAPDSLCWLLNIRGSDVPYTPFLLCYGILAADGRVTLYVEPSRISPDVLAHMGQEVTIVSPGAMRDDMMRFADKSVLYDTTSPVWFYQHLQATGAHIVESPDPCQRAKACKNAVEQQGMRNAHMRDGKAVTQFLDWLDSAIAAGEPLTEISVAQRLEDFRAVSPLYRGPSFSTICGQGAHGAIVHYHATPHSNAAIEKDTLLLIDSGAQYSDGTTDITRTVAVGTPTQAMKTHFTLVLKGHIALAQAVFPEGTTGGQLDILARQYLWQFGLDYDHGTGHGVGSFLSVHEGPQRVAKRGGDAVLEVGMILSNEPGYYKTGAYGIRIENLVLVKEMMLTLEGKRYLGFETLTLVPIDMRLVDNQLLMPHEHDWLNNYHAQIGQYKD